MNRKKIKNLYEELIKLKPDKRLTVVCDWDEVIQPHEPYALWKAILENKQLTEIYTPVNFSEYFGNFWKQKHINYFPYGSELEVVNGDIINDAVPKLLEKQIEIKNSPNFYQETPFLTIAEDLLKLIKENKVEHLIFLSAYDKRKFPNGDERKYKIFENTFAKLAKNWKIAKDNSEVSNGGWGGIRRPLEDIEFHLIGFYSKDTGVSKSSLIFNNIPNVDVVIDDNPIICGNIEATVDTLDEDRVRVFTPCYPAFEEEHIEDVILVNNQVSSLIVDDFGSEQRWKIRVEDGTKLYGSLGRNVYDEEHKQKLDKLLNTKEQNLDIILEIMTEREKEIMIRYGLEFRILGLTNHEKNKIFKWIHKYYNELNKNEQGKK